MRMMKYFAIILILGLALAMPSTALARGLADDRVIFGDTFVLGNGEIQDGNLVVFGGNVVMEAGSRVNGDVVLMGGNLSSSGTIEGDVVCLGGLISLDETAVVQGDVTTIGSNLSRAPGARIEGQVFSEVNSPLTFAFPSRVRVPRFDVRFSPALNAATFILKVFLWAALAVLLVLFVPTQTRRVAQTAIAQPLIAGGLGLLTVVALPVLVLALAITILLIPVSLAVIAVAALAWMFGLIALGLEVGDRMAQLLKQEWAPAVEAGAGTFALILVLNGLQQVVPCIGWIAPAIAGMVGLGAVLLTRFGLQTYPPAMTPLAVTMPPETTFVPPPPEPQEPPRPPEPPQTPEPPQPSEPSQPPETPSAPPPPEPPQSHE